MSKTKNRLWELFKGIPAIKQVLAWAGGGSLVMSTFITWYNSLEVFNALLLWCGISIALFLAITFALLWRKAAKLVELEERYTYEVLNYWDTRDNPVSMASQNLSGKLFEKTILNKNGEVKVIPHPMSNHPSNKCKNCGANPTENKENNNETK